MALNALLAISVVLVMLLLLFISRSSAVTCYECNPCISSDTRSWGSCTGITCVSESSSVGGNTFRYCLQRYEPRRCELLTSGASISKRRRKSISTNVKTQTCYCSTNLCNDGITPENLYDSASQSHISSTTTIVISCLASAAFNVVWTATVRI